jgi:hypothetical protein
MKKSGRENSTANKSSAKRSSKPKTVAAIKKNSSAIEELKSDWVEIDSSGALVLIAVGSEDSKPNKEESVTDLRKWRFSVRAMDILSPLVWLYFFFQTFIIDVPRVALSFISPSHQYLADYKAILFLVIILVQAFLWKRPEIVLFYIYLAFFPLLVLFWKIPKYLVFAQDWRMPFALLSTSVRFFQSFKMHLLLFTAWVTATLYCLSYENPTLLVLAIMVLLVTIVVNYIMRVASVFHGDQLAAKTKYLVEKIAKNLTARNSVNERQNDLPRDMDEKQI